MEESLTLRVTVRFNVSGETAAFIRGEGLIPRGSAAVIKVLNPRPILYENNIPRRTGGPSSAARLLIRRIK
jgi:hypothetical protein